MARKNRTPVVIMRKDKRLNKLGHGLAFALTGGVSGIYSAAKAATNAGYNSRTRQLAAEAEQVEAEQADADRIPRPQRGAPVGRMEIDHTRYASTKEARKFRAEHVPGSEEYKQRHG